MPIMRFLITCTMEAIIHFTGLIVSERSAPNHKAMIYFVFTFTGCLKGAFDMIKGICTQSVVPRHEKELNFFGLLRCPY